MLAKPDDSTGRGRAGATTAAHWARERFAHGATRGCRRAASVDCGADASSGAVGMRAFMSDVEIRQETVGVELRSDLRDFLESEAQHAGVTVSQYVREAAIARVIAARMLSDQGRFERLAKAVREALADDVVARSPHAVELVLAALTRLTAAEVRNESPALVAQSAQPARNTQEPSDA